MEDFLELLTNYVKYAIILVLGILQNVKRRTFIMLKDFTNAFILPSSRKALIEASITETYLANHPKVREQILETRKLVDHLTETYKEVLGIGGTINAKVLNSSIREPLEYKKSFMYSALMQSYRVFDNSHSKYPRLLELVKENDPEWVKYVEADHDAKLSRCKVPIYKIN